MSKAEDRTLNSIRIISDKTASEKQGSIVTNGGICAEKNILCGEIVTGDLVVKGLTKLAGDVSIGGTIYCPGVYSIDGTAFRLGRNLIPGERVTGSTECGGSLGTYSDPWDLVYAGCVNTDGINAGHNINSLCSFQVRDNQTIINSNLDIVNPITNTVSLKTCNGIVEAYAPIYQQWDSHRFMCIPYRPGEILYLTVSNILLDTNGCDVLELCYDANGVPDSTKLRIYFMIGNRCCRINYKLELIRYNKKYVFTSTIPTKKIKFIFIEDCVYLI